MTETPGDKTTVSTTPRRLDPYVQIFSVARSTSSKHVFYTKSLKCIAESFGSPFGMITVRHGAEVIQDDFHSGPTDPKFWKAHLQQFVTEGLMDEKPLARTKRLNPKRGSMRVVFLSAPILDAAGVALGAIGLVVASVREIDVPRRLAILESLARVVSCLAGVLGQVTARDQAAAAASSQQALAKGSTYETAEELAFSITNSLRNMLRCEQVALGLVKRSHVSILSISGMDQISTKSKSVSYLKAAMEECVDVDASIVCEQNRAWAYEEEASNYYLHNQWRAVTMGDGVASIPLRLEGVPRAVLSLRYSPDKSFDKARIEEVQKRVEPFIPALLLTQKASRSLCRHGKDAFSDLIARYKSPGSNSLKIVTVVVALFVGWFIFGTTEYYLTVPAKIMPGHVFHVTAPFDGTLAAAHIREGQEIASGQILCELDREELNQRQAELLAELSVLEYEVDRARADDKPADVEVFRGKQAVVRAKLAGVVSQLEKAIIRSPIEGKAVSGDLDEHIGSVVTRGQLFFQIAERNAWKVELEVPEADVDHVDAGLSGYYVLNARPHDRKDFEISWVRPHAAIRGQKNVYIAEADIDLPAEWIRPGMEGVAKVSVGRKPIWWVTLHRAIDYFRISMWL